jgi:hypothetical protein
MKIALLILIVLNFLSCTQQKISPIESSIAEQKIHPMDQPMPTLQIDMMDRSCDQDADCEHVATQCSCACGKGVNKSQAQKYRDQIKQLCADYRGKRCSIRCDGSVKCTNKVCIYTVK